MQTNFCLIFFACQKFQSIGNSGDRVILLGFLFCFFFNILCLSRPFKPYFPENFFPSAVRRSCVQEPRSCPAGCPRISEWLLPGWGEDCCEQWRALWACLLPREPPKPPRPCSQCSNDHSDKLEDVKGHTFHAAHTDSSTKPPLWAKCHVWPFLPELLEIDA